MLAYAAHRRQRRKLSPTALALIVCGHAVAIVLLASARMEVGIFEPDKPIIVQPIPLPDDPPPPPEPTAKPMPSPPVSNLDTPPKVIVLPLDSGPVVVPGPAPDEVVPRIGYNPVPAPVPQPRLLPPAPPLATTGPKLATAGDLLRPPYPESKRRLEEEATLRLRLSIDERGRVTAVEPIGSVDAAFLDSARRHLTRNWRYRPAMEGDRAVPSSLTITLRFRLEDA